MHKPILWLETPAVILMSLVFTLKKQLHRSDQCSDRMAGDYHWTAIHPALLICEYFRYALSFFLPISMSTKEYFIFQKVSRFPQKRACCSFRWYIRHMLKKICRVWHCPTPVARHLFLIHSSPDLLPLHIYEYTNAHWVMQFRGVPHITYAFCRIIRKRVSEFYENSVPEGNSLYRYVIRLKWIASIEAIPHVKICSRIHIYEHVCMHAWQLHIGKFFDRLDRERRGPAYMWIAYIHKYVYASRGWQYIVAGVARQLARARFRDSKPVENVPLINKSDPVYGNWSQRKRGRERKRKGVSKTFGSYAPLLPPLIGSHTYTNITDCLPSRIPILARQPNRIYTQQNLPRIRAVSILASILDATRPNARCSPWSTHSKASTFGHTSTFRLVSLMALPRQWLSPKTKYRESRVWPVACLL